jgi:4-hydroxymandelate oxidase
VTVSPPSIDLSAIVDVREFEAPARRAMEPAAWDYVAGGAWDEQSLAEAEAAWRRRRLRPRVLVDVSRIDPSTTLAGSRSTLPIAIAPMAAHGLAHPDAEVATARAAAAAGVPFTLSTMATCSMEAVAQAVPDGVRWFQLYAQADAGRTRSLVERAAAAGYRALVVTVDLPVLGYRERDLRNGFDVPPPHGNFPDAGPDHAGHDEREELERLGDPVAGAVSGAEAGPPAGPIAGRHAVMTADLDHALVWDELATIRSWSSLPMILKGILTAEDARLALDHGADGIVVSSHGARQLDRAVAPADVLEEVVEAVDGRAEVWVDGGIRRGLDVVTALALGARGVLVGRPVLWALATAGEAGVARALEILRHETLIAMALLGAPSVADLTRAHVAG